MVFILRKGYQPFSKLGIKITIFILAFGVKFQLRAFVKWIKDIGKLTIIDEFNNEQAKRD